MSNDNTFWQNMLNTPTATSTKKKKKGGDDESSSSSSSSSFSSKKANKDASPKTKKSKETAPTKNKKEIKVTKEKTTPKAAQSQNAVSSSPKHTNFLNWMPLQAAAIASPWNPWTQKPSATAEAEAQLKPPDPPNAAKPQTPSPDSSKDTHTVSKNVAQKAQAANPVNVPDTPSIPGHSAKTLSPFEQFLVRMTENLEVQLPFITPHTPTSTPQTTTPKTRTPKGAATPKKSYPNRKVQFLMEPDIHNVPKDQGKPLARRASRSRADPWRKYTVIAELHKRGGWIQGPGGKMKYIAPGTQPPPPPPTPMDGKTDEQTDEYTDNTERDDDTQLLVTSDKQPKKDTVIPRKVINESTPVKRNSGSKKKKSSKRKVISKRTKGTKKKSERKR